LYKQSPDGAVWENKLKKLKKKAPNSFLNEGNKSDPLKRREKGWTSPQVALLEGGFIIGGGQQNNHAWGKEEKGGGERSRRSSGGEKKKSLGKRNGDSDCRG